MRVSEVTLSSMVARRKADRGRPAIKSLRDAMLDWGFDAGQTMGGVGCHGQISLPMAPIESEVLG